MTTSQRGALGAPVIIGGVIAILILIGAGYYVSQQQTPAEVMENAMKQESILMEESHKDAATIEQGSVTDMQKAMTETSQPSAATTTYSGEVLAGTSSPLLAFNQADYEKALAEGKLVTLYFYANWCPICRAEFPLMQSAFNQLNSSQVVGFRVNYNDNETDANEVALARQFGVAYQHTKVFVRGGEQILKSPEEWSTQRYTQEITSRI